MTAQTAPEAPRPSSRLRRFARWAVPAILVPAVAAGSVAVTSVGADRHPDVARYAPLEPGTTWVYETTTNDEPTGLQRVTVLGRTVYSTGAESTPAVIVHRSYENFLGQGPATSMSYLAVRSGGVDVLASRYGHGDLQANDPPEPSFRAPYRPGTRWSWAGTAGDQEQTSEVSVEETGSVEAAGTTLDGCLRQRRELTYTDAATGETGRETSEEWVCPGVGLVRAITEAPASGVTLEVELVSFAGPGRRLGPSAGPVDPSISAGGTPGFDGGHSGTLPDGELDLDGLAFSDTRNQTSVFAPVGDDARLVLAEIDGFVSLTDLETGEVRWRLRLPEPVVVSPVLAGDLVLAAGSDKALVAIDAELGFVRWNARFGDLVSSAPAVLGGTVVVTTEDRRVLGLSPADGTVRWTARTPAIVSSPPAVAGDLVVVADHGGRLAAFAEDGSEAWSSELDDATVVSPVASGDLVLTVDGGGILAAHDAATGEERWRVLLRGYRAASAAPAAGERIALISENTSGDTFLSAYDLEGNEVWDRALRGEHDLAPVIAGEHVVAVAEDGTVRAFALEDGSSAGERRLTPFDDAAPASAFGGIGYAGGALVVPVHTGPPWGSVTYTGIPVTTTTGGGVAWDAELRVIDAAWRTADLAGNDLVYTDFDGGVWAIGPSGAPRLLADGETAAYAVGAAGGLVLAHVDDEVLAIPAGNPGADPVWRIPAGEAAFGTFAAASEDTAYLPLAGEGLAAVDLGSGAVRWVHPAVGVGITGPSVLLPNGDAVYAMNGIARIHRGTGAVIWREPALETFGRIAVDRERVALIGLTDTSSDLIVLDAARGSVLWRVPVSAAALAGPALGADVAVAVDDRGLARGFDAATGEELWSFRMRTSPCGAPVIDQDGRVFLLEGGHLENLTDREYRVTALDADTGRFLGAFEPLGTSGVTGDCRASGGTLLLSGNLRGQLLEAAP